MLEERQLNKNHDYKYQVQHCAIDLHAINLVEKIALVRNTDHNIIRIGNSDRNDINSYRSKTL